MKSNPKPPAIGFRWVGVLAGPQETSARQPGVKQGTRSSRPSESRVSETHWHSRQAVVRGQTSVCEDGDPNGWG